MPIQTRLPIVRALIHKYSSSAPQGCSNKIRTKAFQLPSRCRVPRQRGCAVIASSFDCVCSWGQSTGLFNYLSCFVLCVKNKQLLGSTCTSSYHESICSHSYYLTLACSNTAGYGVLTAVRCRNASLCFLYSQVERSLLILTALLRVGLRSCSRTLLRQDERPRPVFNLRSAPWLTFQWKWNTTYIKTLSHCCHITTAMCLQ